MDDLKCKIVLKDEVNCKVDGVDAATRRKMGNALAFFLEYSRHTPAFKLGRWDGMKRYCDVGGRTYINLLDQVLPILETAGYNIDIEDLRAAHHFEFEHVDENTLADFTWPEGHVHAGKPVTLRDHQVGAINDFLDNPHGIGEISTGAGKTLICATLSRAVEKYGRSFVIVPSTDLVMQTERDYKLIGLDVGVYYGGRKELGHNHTICTWQALEALEKKEDTDYTLEEIIEGTVAFICDENHTAKGDCLFKILTKVFNNCPIRWGLTGTIPLDKAESTALVAAIGPVISEISAKELQSKGILSNLHIHITQIQDYHDRFPSYGAELKFLVTDPRRVKFLADRIFDISKTGNTLVLVDRISAGEQLAKLLPGSVFVKGEMKNVDRKSEYTAIQTSTNKIIIATYGVASTGLDIPRLFNVIMLEAGKSFIKVIQTIGRGIRVAEDKDFVDIYDFCSSAKFSKKHLTERKKFYKSKEYPFSVTKIDGDYL